MNKEYKIDADVLKKMIQEGNNLFILDVRPKEQRDEWMIPESHFLDAYERLNTGDYTVLNEIEIPTNTKVVTVCAAGRISQVATNELRKKGIESYSLAGGMKAWNYVWDTAELITGNTKIIQIRRVAKGCLSYLIGQGEEAMVVDASLDPEVYITLAKENGWQIKSVTDTHIHADYVSRTRELAKVTNAKHIMIDVAAVEYPFEKIANREVIRWESTEVKIFHTPGHTWESTSFLINNKVLLTGDTLFIDGIGRPDLKADEHELRKKAEALYRSLQSIATMNVDILILPAHISTPIKIGQTLISKSLGEIKSENKTLSLDIGTFVNSIASKLPPTPPNYLAIAEINKKGVSPDVVLAEIEAGANRCAIV